MKSTIQRWLGQRRGIQPETRQTDADETVRPPERRQPPAPWTDPVSGEPIPDVRATMRKLRLHP